MSSTIAAPASRNDVGLRISSTDAPRTEMFGCELVVHGMTQGQAVSLGKGLRRSRPHGLIAIKAEAMLLLEGMGALSRN
jgi:hypothetical protein